MGKARIYGMKTTYIPNSKADMRHRKKTFHAFNGMQTMKTKKQDQKEKNHE